MEETQVLDPIVPLTRDLAQAAATLSADEARFLVDAYYMIQENRKAAYGQLRSLVTADEPHATLNWLAEQQERLENQIKRALGVWADNQSVSVWAQSIKGIGPVLAAGLAAHIDISRAPTVGHIWRFAGLDPTSTWGKGEKRPWNADLKVLCWKIGESFVKVSGDPEALYGQVYVERKVLETTRNEALAFKDQAERILATKKIGKDTEAYKAYSVGKLPPAHIHARAKRYAVKLFLSHYHHVAYRVAYGIDPPKPFILTQPEHTHFIPPPNFP